MTSKYMKTKFRKQYIAGIFRSKLLFAIETWGGCSHGLITKIQELQNKAAKMALGTNSERLTPNQRHKELNWLQVKDEIVMATHKQNTRNDGRENAH